MGPKCFNEDFVSPRRERRRFPLVQVSKAFVYAITGDDSSSQHFSFGA